MSTRGEQSWFKSSYSGSEGDSRVEVAFGTGAVHVRDSKTRDGPRFAVPAGAWGRFLRYVRR